MNTFASLFAVLADSTIKTTVLLALAWAVGRALKQRSSASRHLVRSFALAAALLLPLLSYILPAWRVRGIPQFRQNDPPSAALANLQPDVNVAASPAATNAPVKAAIRPKVFREKAAPASVDVPMQQPAPSAIQPARVASPERFTLDWRPWLAVAWLIGVLIFLSRMLASRVRWIRLLRNTVTVEDRTWIYQLQSVAREMGIRRPVVLLQSAETEVPLAAGLRHPQVILPADHAEWSPARRSAVLHHELAHIQRLDSLTQPILDLAVVLYWFHPLIWITAAAIRAEREHACDDCVLALGAKPSEYAHELLEIASSLRRPALGAALAMARRSQLEGRLLALLNPALRRGSVSRKLALAVAALTLCVVFPLAAIRAAQQSKPSPIIRDQATTPATTQHTSPPSAKPGSDDDQEEDMSELPNPPDPPDPPELAVMPGPAEQAELANLQAALANLLAQRAALEQAEASAARSNKEAEMEARTAELRAQIAAMRALLMAESASPRMPGIVGGVSGGIGGGGSEGVPGGVSGGVPSFPAIPSVPSVPGIPSVPAIPAMPGGDLNICGPHTKMHHISIDNDNGRNHWSAYWSGENCSVELRAEGKIEFNGDATSIENISAGGFFEVNQRQSDTWKQIRITPSASGLQFVYRVNDTQQPFDDQAKAWFSNFLLELERGTGFAADSRVRKLLEKGGPAAVLDEINQLHGDYVRGIYFRKLLEQPSLPPAIVARVIDQAGRQIGGDYEKARVLMEVARQYSLEDESTRTAFLNAAGKLGSDYEHARVLIELLKRPNISSRDVDIALHSAASIRSDYEKSRILLSLLGQKSFEQSYLDFYLKMVASIQSDYEKSRDLLAPMQKYPLDQKQINQIMDATTTIGSDYEKSRLLNGLVEKGKFDEKQIGVYLKVVDSMGSPYERSRSLIALMDHNTLGKDALDKVLDATGRIGSDYEKSRVLLTVSRKYPLEGALRDKYISIANTLSEYEKNRALAGIVKRASI